MIVIGYQGIGKSTLAGQDNKFIDLESGNFWVDDKRAEDWYKPYCQIAEHLSQQGYIVFTSSHEVVRNQLKGSKEDVIIAFPSLHLKDEWIAKLKDRYERTKTEKDYKAYMNAEDRYDENIQELIDDTSFHHVNITHMEYDLKAGILDISKILTGEL